MKEIKDYLTDQLNLRLSVVGLIERLIRRIEMDHSTVDDVIECLKDHYLAGLNENIKTITADLYMLKDINDACLKTNNL